MSNSRTQTPTEEQVLSRRKIDLMAKRANFERLARKAAQGNTGAIRLLPKAKALYIEARREYDKFVQNGE